MAKPRYCSLPEALTSSRSDGVHSQPDAPWGFDGYCAGGIRGLRDVRVYCVIYEPPQSKAMREYYATVHFDGMLVLTAQDKVTFYKGTAIHVDRMASYSQKAAGRTVLSRTEVHPSCSRRSHNVQGKMGDQSPGFLPPADVTD
jgi:hypothetical protein